MIGIPTSDFFESNGFVTLKTTKENCFQWSVTFQRAGKFTFLLSWTLNNSPCLYIGVIHNQSSGASVKIFPIYINDEASNRTISISTISYDSSSITVKISSNQSFWDSFQIIAPSNCKVTGYPL